MASASDKRGGRSVMRKPSDEYVFVLKQCNVHPSQNMFEQHGANLCCPRFEPETTFAFWTVIPARVWIFGTSHNESHGSRIHGMRTRSKFSMALAEITLEEQEECCRGSETIAATHVSVETSCRILLRTRDFVTWDHTSCRAHSHANPNDSSFLPRSQIHQTRQTNTFQSCVCEPLDLQSLCQQYLSTSRECFQLFSERAKESGSRPPGDCSCRIL